MRLILLVSFLFLGFSVFSQNLRYVPHQPGKVTTASDMTTIEYGGDLYFAGRILMFNDSAFFGLVRMDASGNIEQVGPFESNFEKVTAIATHQGKLIVAYDVDFDDRVASWDGTSWDTLGSYFDRDIRSIVSFNGQLIIAGDFEEYGPNNDTLVSVAKWNGTDWQEFGPRPNRDANSLAVHDSTLFLGGEFDIIGTDSVAFIAFWNGSDWAQLGVGLEDDVNNMLSTPDGLIIDGDFNNTGDGSLALKGITNWNGGAFNLLPGADFLNHTIVNIRGYGYGFNGGQVTILDPYGFPILLKQNGIANGSLYNGDIFAINNFDYPSYEEVTGYGKLIDGSDCANIDMAGVSFAIGALGDFENPVNNTSAVEVPVGSGLSTLFYCSVFAVGTSGNQLFASGTDYPNTDLGRNMFRAGPTANQTNQNYNEQFHQVWKIDKGLLWNHLADWNTPGYQIPYAIASYPGNGDISNGEANVIAPFDEDFPNNSYEPDLGDYPQLKGDASLITVRSDKKMELNTASNPVGLDIVSQTYTYDVAPNDPLYQVIFSEKRISNRSGRSYDSLFIGFFVDFDIGNYENDFIGTDSTLNLIYGYNSDNNDVNGIVNGYGIAPPAQGFKVLNQTLYSATEFDGMSTLGFLSDSVWRNVAMGRSANGLNLTTPSNNLTRFVYHGDPNIQSEWSEVSAVNMGNDRRMFCSAGPFLNVQDGDEICFEVAHIYARDTINNTNLTNVTLLKQRANDIQNWYDQNSVGCGQYIPVGVVEEVRNNSFSIFPNPSSGLITIMRSKMNAGALQVRALDGRLLRQISLPNNVKQLDIDLSSYTAGTYLISILGELGTETKRVIID